MLNFVLKCIKGPQLYQIFALSSRFNNETLTYKQNGLETVGSNVIKSINFIFNIGLYTSPFFLIYLYRKEYFCFDGLFFLTKLSAGFGILLMAGLVIRGLGRLSNPAYREFLSILCEAEKKSSLLPDKSLSKYDFAFWAWPVNFSVKELDGDKSKPKTTPSLSSSIDSSTLSPLSLPSRIIAYCCMHLFGRQLIYPGSIQLLQAVMDPMLQTGRRRLVINTKGQRHKLLTEDDNEIDTMFVDRRSKTSSDGPGSTLVVCCEGNAGFYEVGIMATPLEAGFSVLGWNHPGFGGSTGTPFPAQEAEAVDAVMQFAISRLGFEPDRIVVYAWSIGGFVGTIAASKYPQIRGLVLDATFDDLLPLAVARMPPWMEGVVSMAVRSHMNLAVSEQLSHYPGPVTVVRRVKDEIIATIEGDVSTNRGNELLVRLLCSRYPRLCDSDEAAHTLRHWTNEDHKVQEVIYNSWEFDEGNLQATLASAAQADGSQFGRSLGSDMNDKEKTAMLLYIARKTLVNVDTGHNNPLEHEYFKVPWTPMEDPSFVQL